MANDLRFGEWQDTHHLVNCPFGRKLWNLQLISINFVKKEN